MAKVREKQLQKRKQETLDVAVRLLMERGYANLNMDELAEEVGISKPTLYQYFNSKEELIAEAIVRMFEHMEEQIGDLSDVGPLEQLEHFLRAMLKSRYEGRNLMANMDGEIRKLIFQRYPKVVEHMIAARDKLAQIVRKAQEQGQIDPALQDWVVVNMMFSLQGIVGNHYMKSEVQHSDAEMLQAIDSIVRMFKRAVAVEVPVEASILS